MSGFGLANPWLLGALAVLAVPVLLHLVIREDRRGVGFPSLMFIPRTPYRARRRRTLRDKALLALRCLALLALILAFAGPQLLDTAPAPIAAGPRHDSVLLVDRSYSMSPARRWAALQQAASDTIDAADTDTRVALLAFDHRTRLVAPFSSDRDELRRRLTDLSPSAGGTGFANAFDAATRLLGESTADRRSIVLFSDLQQSALVDLDRLRLPAGVEVRVVPIETPIGANAALLDAVLLDASDTAVANHGPTDASRAEPPPDPLAGPLERGVRIRIASTGDQPLTETRLGVRLDDAPPTSLSIQLAPGQTRELDVPVVLARDRAQVLHLSLGDDAIAADNTLTLVLQPDRPVRVALPGPATQTARPDRTAPIYARHLTHALAVAGERRFEMVYAALQRAPDEPALPRELNGLPIDIWALDAGLLETAVLRERVEAFVRHGGGVLLTLDPRLASDAASNVTSSRELALPGGLRAVDAITYPGSGAALASTLTTGRARKDNDTSGWPDRLDAALGAPALLGALAQVRVYSARTLRGLDRSDVTILLSLEDGHPWLVEQTLGSGRLVLSTSGLMPPSTNLALEPGFVPLAQRLVEHLAGRTPVPAWLQRGEVVDLRQVAALTPNGAAWRDFLANRGSVVLEHADGTRQRSTPGQPFVTLGTPGLTRVHASDGSQPALLLAANENRRESLLDRATPEQLLARMEHLPALPASARASRASATAGDGPRPADGRPLGWYLLWIALLLLLGEGLLAALSRRSPAATR